MAKRDEDFYIKRTITLPRSSKLTEEIIQQLDQIMNFAPPEAYRNTLIEIYHIYICKEHDSLPSEFRAMADHMYFLVDFFRKASEEMKEGSLF